MKKQLLGLALISAFLGSSVAEAYTWGAYQNGRAGSSNYRDSYTNSTGGSSSYHSYLNYGRVGNVSGGYVSIPTSTTIHQYQDADNAIEVKVTPKNVRPPSGNFGKAINRGASIRRYY